MCGDCCSSWNIPIEAHKAQQLLEKPWVQERLALTRRVLTPVSEALYRIPLTDENVCVFLAEDRRCLVEAHEGLALKPHECQRFPFATVTMPDGVARHDTSAACKRISDTLLLAFQPILPKPSNSSSEALSVQEEQRLLHQQEDASFDPVETFPTRIHVGLLRTISLETYEDWLQQLRTIFMTPGVTPEAALFQARLLLLNRRSTRPRSQQPVMKETFRIATWRRFWVTLFFLRKPYQTLTWIRLLRGKTYEDPRLFGFSIDLNARRCVRWNSAQDDRLNAFVFNILSRRLPVARGQSLKSLLAMATCAALLVQWYAITLAWVRDSVMVEEQDVSIAIRLVERYYTGHQPRFMRFFHSRWKGQWLQWFLLR